MSRALDAARNNADWCDAVCSAHGGPGEFFDVYWLTRAPTPPYYPSLVTLGSSSAPALAAVRELARARPSASWAVKDSFAALPLGQEGFQLLFEAEWIVRPASPRSASVSARWYRVSSASALTAWEEAWGQSSGRPRVFLPALLARKEIAILAALDGDGAIAAGVVANRSGEVVGMSNLFVRGDAAGSLRAECVEAAADAFPGLPLVGHESGEDLARSHALGFSSLGPLRVWTKEVRPSGGMVGQHQTVRRRGIR